MTMGISGYATKKQLKAAIGKELRPIETSLFGTEFKPDGWNTVVGPSPQLRKWFAQVRCKSGIIQEVK